MKRLIALLLFPFVTLAQQAPQFTFNNDFNSYVNPSYMVNDYALNVNAWHRQQWAEFEGRPISTLFNASFKVDKAKSALGISVLWDKIGAQDNGGGFFNYAFDGKIGEHHLIPGIQMGVLYNVLDGSRLDPIQQNDPNIISGKSSGVGFDLGLSFAYRFRGLTIGLSAMNLLGSSIEFEEGGTLSEYTVARNYYGLISYEGRWKHFRFKPISFVKTDGASTQFDQFIWLGACNLNKVFDGVSAGVGYRLDDAIMAGLELAFKWFSIGYSYDFSISGLRNYSTGSHEIHLRSHLFKAKENQKIKTD